MKKIIIIVLITFTSCKEGNDKSTVILRKIQSSNIELFEGVKIEARNKKDGIYLAPFLTKELDGKMYVLPNFNYYGCQNATSECLTNITTKKFDIIEFAQNNHVSSDPYEYSNKFASEIFKEFENLGVVEILSDSDLGKCIIFSLDENNYIAFVEDIKSIKNEFWKKEFIEKNKIESNWYRGSL
jgi:hypothetical protein